LRGTRLGKGRGAGRSRKTGNEGRGSRLPCESVTILARFVRSNGVEADLGGLELVYRGRDRPRDCGNVSFPAAAPLRDPRL